MKALLIAVGVVAMVAGAADESSAQTGTFVTAGISSDYSQRIPGIAVGASVDLAHSWISVGGQGDLFVSGLYVGVRGGPFAQLNFIRRGSVRPFIIGGRSWGVGGGSMVGAGVETRLKERLGLRTTVEDYIARSETFNHSPFTSHQLSVQVGIVWR